MYYFRDFQQRTKVDDSKVNVALKSDPEPDGRKRASRRGRRSLLFIRSVEINPSSRP